MDFYQRLKYLRKQRNMTIKELSEKTGINYRLLQKYESGEVNPKTNNLEKIAQVLDVSKETLIARELLTLKDIDLDTSDKDIVRQLLFQLEEKGLFFIETVNVQEQAGGHVVTIPIDSITAKEIVKWKSLK